MHFAKFLRTVFFIEHLPWLLLDKVNLARNNRFENVYDTYNHLYISWIYSLCLKLKKETYIHELIFMKFLFSKAFYEIDIATKGGAPLLIRIVDLLTTSTIPLFFLKYDSVEKKDHFISFET